MADRNDVEKVTLVAEIARLKREAAEREAFFQRERAARKAEAAQKRAVREAEAAAQERAVREADAARERAEREAVAAKREVEAVREREAVAAKREVAEAVREGFQRERAELEAKHAEDNAEATARHRELKQTLRESDLFMLRSKLEATTGWRSHAHVRDRAPWTVDATGASVFHGLTNCDSSVLAAVNDGIADLSAPLPKKYDDENTVVHARLTAVFKLIQQKLLAAGLPCLKSFHENEAKAGSDTERPDWVFTRRCETAPLNINILFYVEAKAVTTSAMSRGDLMKDGVLQCIQRIVTRHQDTDRTTTSCIGVATNGINVAFVRVNFDAADYPCFLARDLFLTHQVGDDVSVCPKGLEYLVRLMCNDDPTVFGLPPFPDGLVARYSVGRTLGQGGFGNVFAVTENVNAADTNVGGSHDGGAGGGVGGAGGDSDGGDSVTAPAGAGTATHVPRQVDGPGSVVDDATGRGGGVQLACKLPRHSNGNRYLTREYECLCRLQVGCVPGVPQVVAWWDGQELGGRSWLVMSPVGVPLLKYMADQKWRSVRSAARKRFLLHVFHSLHAILQAAHGVGVGHGDVRPANVVVVVPVVTGGDVAAPTVSLIDWGLSYDLGSKVGASCAHGVPEHMSKNMLRARAKRVEGDDGYAWTPCADDDWCALGYTYVGLTNTLSGRTPWPVNDALLDVDAATKCRDMYMRKRVLPVLNQRDVSKYTPEELREVYRVIVRADFGDAADSVGAASSGLRM